MNRVDQGVMNGLVTTLQRHLDKVEVYHFVPSGARFPYVSLEFKKMGAGNGQPSPHFKRKITFLIEVWSTYPGMKEIQSIVEQIESALENKEIQLEKGKAYIQFDTISLTGQKDSKTQQVRCGEVECTAFVSV